MVSFRKSLLLMALIALCGVLAMAQSSAYPAAQCTANTATPPIARAEGFTEEMGQVLITCTGGVPTAKGVLIPTINIQIFLSTNITSRVLADPFTEALAIVDEAGADRFNPDGSAAAATPQLVCGAANTGYDSILGYCPIRAYNSIGTMDYTGVTNDGDTIQRPNIWQARCTGAVNSCANAPQNQLVWLGIPYNAPGTSGQRTIRLVNVRGNANALGVSSTFIPTQINMYISVSGTAAPPLANPNQTVAFVQQGLSFAVEAGRSGSTSPGPYFQCAAPPDWNLYATGVRGCVNLLLRFSENFGTAFRTNRFSGINQNYPGRVYNTEALFYGSNLPDLRDIGRGVLKADYEPGDGSSYKGAGTANNPTRLKANFTNVPPNIALWASGEPIATNYQGTSEIWAVFREGANSSGGSGSTVNLNFPAFRTRPDCGGWPSRWTFYSSGFISNLFPMYGVGLSLDSTTGLYSGVAVWDVIRYTGKTTSYGEYGVHTGAWSACSSPNMADGRQCTGAGQLNIFWMGITVQYTGQPGLGTMTIAGSYAPTSTADRWSASGGLTAGMPRFSPNPTGATNLEIIGCRTNLLFPYITNRDKFDTGIAISNTSRDPFGTTTQTGPCRLFFYGGWTSDPTRSTLTIDTPTDIVPGTSYTFALSGGVPNATNGDQTRTFQGYMIASCRFQYAHGYAFISDFGTNIFAQGYLALVMDADMGSRTGFASETLGH